MSSNSATGSEADRFLGEHPGFALTLAYLYVSTLGSVYQWSYFREFGVNVFDFAEANDFLLAAFRQPLAFLLLLGCLLTYAIFVFLDEPMAKRTHAFAGRLAANKTSLSNAVGRGVRFLSRGSFWQRSFGLLIKQVLWAGIFSMYSLAPMLVMASADAEKLKTARPLVCVERKEAANPQQRVFVGSTERFLFFTGPDMKETSIVPITQVIEIRRLASGGACKAAMSPDKVSRQA